MIRRPASRYAAPDKRFDSCREQAMSQARAFHSPFCMSESEAVFIANHHDLSEKQRITIPTTLYNRKFLPSS